MEEGPWNYYNNLLLMQDWVKDLNPLDIPFEGGYFWIQVRGLPKSFLVRDVATKVANSFTDCMAIELSNGNSGTRFFRLKAFVSVHKPVRRMIGLRDRGGIVPRLGQICSFLWEMGLIALDQNCRKIAIYSLAIKALPEKSNVVYRLEEVGGGEEDREDTTVEEGGMAEAIGRGNMVDHRSSSEKSGMHGEGIPRNQERIDMGVREDQIFRNGEGGMDRGPQPTKPIQGKEVGGGSELVEKEVARNVVVAQLDTNEVGQEEKEQRGPNQLREEALNFFKFTQAQGKEIVYSKQVDGPIKASTDLNRPQQSPLR